MPLIFVYFLWYNSNRNNNNEELCRQFKTGGAAYLYADKIARKGGIVVYEIGDYVIKANNGVCRIEDILHLDLPNADKDRLYYLLIPIENKNAKLYVPTDAGEDTLRRALNEEQAWEVIRKIPEVEAAWITNDKLREQAYKEAIHSCNPTALISIIKNLYLRRKQRTEQGKKNTATDDRYFKLAEDNLYSELAFALGKGKAEMRQLIADTIRLKNTQPDHSAAVR